MNSGFQVLADNEALKGLRSKLASTRTPSTRTPPAAPALATVSELHPPEMVRTPWPKIKVGISVYETRITLFVPIDLADQMVDKNHRPEIRLSKAMLALVKAPRNRLNHLRTGSREGDFASFAFDVKRHPELLEFARNWRCSKSEVTATNRDGVYGIFLPYEKLKPPYNHKVSGKRKGTPRLRGPIDLPEGTDEPAEVVQAAPETVEQHAENAARETARRRRERFVLQKAAVTVPIVEKDANDFVSMVTRFRRMINELNQARAALEGELNFSISDDGSLSATLKII